GEVDDLLWKATEGRQAGWALYLYKEHFPSGKHKNELPQRLQQIKQKTLAAVRSGQDLEAARNFLIDYKTDPEAPEVRNILFHVLEQGHRGNEQSPPPAVLRRLSAGPV